MNLIEITIQQVMSDMSVWFLLDTAEKVKTSEIPILTHRHSFYAVKYVKPLTTALHI